MVVGMSSEMFVMETVGGCVGDAVDFKVEVTTASVVGNRVVVDGLGVEVAIVTDAVERKISSADPKTSIISTED